MYPFTHNFVQYEWCGQTKVFDKILSKTNICYRLCILFHIFNYYITYLILLIYIFIYAPPPTFLGEHMEMEEKMRKSRVKLKIFILMFVCLWVWMKVMLVWICSNRYDNYLMFNYHLSYIHKIPIISHCKLYSIEIFLTPPFDFLFWRGFT